ncbi:MAG: N-acetylmuramoyl-L-alanine amidase [Candidatus Eisenbacteria bacterium]
MIPGSRTLRSWVLIWVFGCLRLLCGSPAAAEPAITAARIGVTDQRTRLVFELSAPGLLYASRLEGDSLLILTLPNLANGERWPTWPAPAGRLQRISAAVDGGRRSLRLTLLPPSAARIFLLGRDRELPDRLVIDVAPKDASPPVNAGKASPPTDRGSAQAVRHPEPPTAASRVVVIDPGHGGEDPGAIGGDLKEKDVAFDVAARMATKLAEVRGLRVVRTRERDERVPLRRRFRAAEEATADLFVSIHLNASPNRTASGAEVYFLSIGAATDEAAKEAARLENEADADYVVDEDAALGNLPFSVSLRQSDTLRRSSRLAEVVLDLLADRDLAEARGVRQAGFAVLKSYQVPSILVEVGFISSEQDRVRLALPDYRQKLAEALADGVLQYLQDFAPKKTGP